jgi:plastocyanin
VTVTPKRESSELENVIVYVRRLRPSPSAPRHAEIRQVNEEFVPHIVAVTTGSRVEFPNDDVIFHNVFSLSRAGTFDLGRYPRHASKSRTFNTPGIIKVFCHLHSHMNAVVRVFDHPHFAIPGPDGRFTIAGLEPGSHELAAWHERVGEATVSVVVVASEATETEFSLPLTDQ